MAQDPKIGRREFLTVAGAAAAALAPVKSAEAQQAQPVAAPAPGSAPASPLPPVDEPLLTLTATEHAFVAAAADTLIPADALSPSGSDCGVAVFIDRQLAGAYGSGARLYRDGPFPKGQAERGYSWRSIRASSSAPVSRPPTIGPARPMARTSTAWPSPSARRP